METFTALKKFVANPRYSEQRKRTLHSLDLDSIDNPIRNLIQDLSQLPFCFTLQSCYGHFLHDPQMDPHNLDPLPASDDIEDVQYRIAYIALCIQDSAAGRQLYSHLEKIPALDPEYIQFGCAEWFRERQINSFALQVEPRRFMYKDQATIPYQEALHVQQVREIFFKKLEEIVKNYQ
ncbi:hypothetical protein ACFL6A_02650 [bacterium]